MTLDELKIDLRLEGTTEHDDRLQQALDDAEVLVLDYVKNYAAGSDDRATRYAVIDAWTAADAPAQVKRAIRSQAAYLWRFAGDDEVPMVPKGPRGDLPDSVTMFLTRLRDPGMA